ncbi:hemerythrin domain-containing protein [Mycobacterium sp. TJFP1]
MPLLRDYIAEHERVMNCGREAVRALVREHRELGALLESVDLSNADDREQIRTAVDDLYEHIAKEEDGLFPASLTFLDGEQWDQAISGWQAAHPGNHMIEAG